MITTEINRPNPLWIGWRLGHRNLSVEGLPPHWRDLTGEPQVGCPGWWVIPLEGGGLGVEWCPQGEPSDFSLAVRRNTGFGSSPTGLLEWYGLPDRWDLREEGEHRWVECWWGECRWVWDMPPADFRVRLGGKVLEGRGLGVWKEGEDGVWRADIRRLDLYDKVALVGRVVEKGAGGYQGMYTLELRGETLLMGELEEACNEVEDRVRALLGEVVKLLGGGV